MQSIAPAPVPQMHHQEMSADNDLRAQLAAVINTSQQQQQHPPNPHPHGYGDPRASSSASPHDHNIDPSIGGGPGGGMMSGGAAGDSGGDDNMGDGRKGGKRELSQSKRAAQNRAAQRAFRQRKEGYIKKLEEQVRELHALEDSFKNVQAENYSLREYIIHLQSRLLETQGDLPPPPPNINLTHPSQGHPPVRHLETAVAVGPPLAQMSQLQASAARNIAAAGLQSTKHVQEEGYEQSKRFKSDENVAGEEEIIRAQLQGSGSGHSL